MRKEIITKEKAREIIENKREFLEFHRQQYINIIKGTEDTEIERWLLGLTKEEHIAECKERINFFKNRISYYQKFAY